MDRRRAILRLREEKRRRFALVEEAEARLKQALVDSLIVVGNLVSLKNEVKRLRAEMHKPRLRDYLD